MAIDLKPKENVSLLSFFDDLQKISQIVDAFLTPFVQIVQEFVKVIEPVISKGALVVLEILDDLQLKSELVRNYWIIMDEKLLKILKESNKRNIAEMEEIIIAYYKEEKFSNLRELFNQYRTNKSFESRFPIIDSCITVLQNTPVETSSQVVIPTILSQITGIYETLPELVPEQQKREIKKILKEQDKKNLCPLSADGKKPVDCQFVVQGNVKINKDVFEHYIMQKVSVDIYYDYKNIIINTFKNGKQIDKLQDDIKKNNVFRHKILHGVDLQYNSTENVVKCFMELAFLMKMYTQLSEENVND